MADLKIKIEKPSEAKLKELDVSNWGIWVKEPSSFVWFYDDNEVCYLLEGEASVKTSYETVTFGKGDLVSFPKGLSCSWEVKKKVRKHYKSIK